MLVLVVVVVVDLGPQYSPALERGAIKCFVFAIGRVRPIALCEA